MDANNQSLPNTDANNDDVPARAGVHRPRATYMADDNLNSRCAFRSSRSAHDHIYTLSGFYRDAIMPDVDSPPEDTRILIFTSCPHLRNADTWIRNLKHLTTIVIMNCPYMKYSPYALSRLRFDYANIRVVDHDCSGAWEKQVNDVAREIETALVDLIENSNASYCVQLILWEELKNLKSRLGIKEAPRECAM